MHKTVEKGDIHLNKAHHVVMSVDSYNVVTASINEKGTTKGGKPVTKQAEKYTLDLITNIVKVGIATIDMAVIIRLLGLLLAIHILYALIILM